jgi:hypothetical protein
LLGVFISEPERKSLFGIEERTSFVASIVFELGGRSKICAGWIYDVPTSEGARARDSDSRVGPGSAPWQSVHCNPRTKLSIHQPGPIELPKDLAKFHWGSGCLGEAGRLIRHGFLKNLLCRLYDLPQTKCAPRATHPCANDLDILKMTISKYY